MIRHDIVNYSAKRNRKEATSCTGSPKTVNLTVLYPHNATTVQVSSFILQCYTERTIDGLPDLQHVSAQTLF